jgi:Big-like domain-containing protein
MMKMARRACAAVLLLMLGAAWTSPRAFAQLLPPPGSLVVTMTSPASGSTVAGTVPVSASVSIVGSLVVAGVQFKLDGANLGAEDTSAPYSVSWDTTAASNGSHTLTAVARDQLGLQYTSNAVTVTVFNDTTPPTVSITAPANGATVSGTINVSADASDNVSVAGVQFLLDGAALGAEDTAAPYSVALDTTKVANGSHTLTATARDAAGNHATSAPVTVTVSNAVPPAVKRFEETDSSVTLSSGWASDASESWSGGTAAVSTAPGAQATFTFTGTSVNWIGGRSTGTGIARVSVDGTFVAEIDTYSKTEEIRVTMFTVNGLASTSHTLTIEATGQMNAAATSAVVMVDAFDVPAPAVSRLQETDPDVTYTAGWSLGVDTSRAWSAGFAAVSSTSGAQATFTFTGTSISWIGARGPQTGIASVSLDGVMTTVDTYFPTEQIQQTVFTATGLADASHTLTIAVTGQQNPASQGALVVVDAFEVTSSGMQIQETDPSIAYGPGWIQDNRDKAYSQGSSAESNTVGAQATFTFTGTGVRWIGARGPQTGIARVFLDGAFVEDIDTYALTEGPQHTDFTATGLAAGTHTLTIQVIGKNPASTNFWILIDAFDVVP